MLMLKYTNIKLTNMFLNGTLTLSSHISINEIHLLSMNETTHIRVGA